MNMNNYPTYVYQNHNTDPPNFPFEKLPLNILGRYKNIYYVQKNSILFHIVCPLCNNNLSYYFVENENNNNHFQSNILPYVITTAIVSFITIHLFFKL